MCLSETHGSDQCAATSHSTCALHGQEYIIWACKMWYIYISLCMYHEEPHERSWMRGATGRYDVGVSKDHFKFCTIFVAFSSLS